MNEYKWKNNKVEALQFSGDNHSEVGVFVTKEQGYKVHWKDLKKGVIGNVFGNAPKVFGVNDWVVLFNKEIDVYSNDKFNEEFEEVKNVSVGNCTWEDREGNRYVQNVEGKYVKVTKGEHAVCKNCGVKGCCLWCPGDF